MTCCLSLSKKNLKFELIIWKRIDVRFVPLLLLNRTEELSDETPNFRKATISLKWRLAQNISGCRAAVLTNQSVIVSKFHHYHLFANSPHGLDPRLAQLSWRQCVDLHVFHYVWFHFCLGCEIQLNPHFMVWTKYTVDVQGILKPPVYCFCQVG